MVLIIDKEKEGLLSFYRMLDTDTGEIEMGSEIYVKQLINSGKICMENALIKFNRIVGYNGDFGKFASIKRKTGREPVIIVKEVVTPNSQLLGYRVTNTKGEIASMSVQEVIAAARAGILFNGKLKQVAGNRMCIVPFKGYFSSEVVS